MQALGTRASVVTACELSSCGALLLRGMWNLPGPGIEPMCPHIRQADSYPLHHQGNPFDQLQKSYFKMSVLYICH